MNVGKMLIFETLREGAGINWCPNAPSAQDPSKMSIYIGEINVDIYHKYNIDIYYNILPQLPHRLFSVRMTFKGYAF